MWTGDFLIHSSLSIYEASHARHVNYLQKAAEGIKCTLEGSFNSLAIDNILTGLF